MCVCVCVFVWLCVCARARFAMQVYPTLWVRSRVNPRLTHRVKSNLAL